MCLHNILDTKIFDSDIEILYFHTVRISANSFYLLDSLLIAPVEYSEGISDNI